MDSEGFLQLKWGDNFEAKTCQEVLALKDSQVQDWEPSTLTKWLVNTSASIFGLLQIFGIYIFVKYLVVRANVRRKSMMVFYIVTVIDLAIRMAIMIMMNYMTFFSIKALTLSVIALMFSLLTGTAHTHILNKLTIDLKTIMNNSNEQQEETAYL